MLKLLTMYPIRKGVSCFRVSLGKSLGNISQAEQQSKSLRQSSTSSNIDQSAKNNSEKIVIPTRIERGPTDILKALSSTVKRDYTAPHYKYHDDPFLIPTSNMSKRMFAMSQESGRKAAQWIRQEHTDLFQHKVADPPIEAFFPRAVYNENSEVDEDVLKKVIEQHQVSDSVTVYNLLESKGVEVSKETKQSLLELLCYYNGQDTLEEDWIEERWFRQGMKGREKRMNKWKRGCTAEKLFESMSPPDAASYSALLCGKALHGDVDGAYRLYQEAMDARVVLPVEAFNKLVAGAPSLKEGHDLRWKFVEEMLSTMKQQGVAPNLGTLNAVLETLSTMSNNKNSQKKSLGVMAEFRAMGIEPSLASYYFLLNTFCVDKRDGVTSAILINILDILQGKSLDIHDPRDVLFFTEAMAVCRFHLGDLDTAYRLDKLLHTGNNYNLIGDSFKESVYYRNFFALLCQMGTLQEFMDVYNKLVPNIYVPEPGIMEEIIKTVDINEAPELLPRLWSDIVMFEQADRDTVVTSLLKAMQRSYYADEEVKGKLADVAWSIWERTEGQREDRIKKISWTGQMLGDIMQVLLRADQFEQAAVILRCLESRQQQVLGVPSFESLAAFVDKAIERKETKHAIACIQYSSEAGFEDTVKLAQKLNESGELSENERTLLTNLLGREAVAATS